MENLTIPENTTLVTMDVTSLYTNIPHDDGIAAYKQIWEQRTDQKPPTECSVEMNVRVKGSYIHGNKRGIFWNG
jgi:hypothetical protein